MLYKYLLISIFLVVGCNQTTTAQAQPDIQAVKNKKLPYEFWVHYPKGYHDRANRKKTYPIIMYLHGRSIMGTDLEKVKRYGVIYEILRGLEVEFIVIAPQCQRGWDNKKLIQVLDYAEQNYRVNKQKVYLTGMSMGGYGAWYLAGAHPDRFAAVAPVAGGGRTRDAENLKRLPHWVFHGSKDKPVPIEESKKMVKAIKAAGNHKVKFTIRRDWGHSEAIRVFRMPELYKWFLTHKRNVRRYGMSEELDPRLEHQEINSNWVHEDSSPELPKTREAPDVVPTPKRSGVITTLSVATVDQSNRSINNRVLEHPPSIDLNPDEYIQPLTEQGLARQDAIYQADILAAQQLNEQLRKEQRLEWLKFWKWKIKKKRRVEAEKPIREEITYLTPLSDDQLAEQQKIYKHNLMLAEALRRKGEKE